MSDNIFPPEKYHKNNVTDSLFYRIRRWGKRPDRIRHAQISRGDFYDLLSSEAVFRLKLIWICGCFPDIDFCACRNFANREPPDNSSESGKELYRLDLIQQQTAEGWRKSDTPAQNACYMGCMTARPVRPATAGKKAVQEAAWANARPFDPAPAEQFLWIAALI